MIAAKTDAERTSLLARNDGLIGTELRDALLKEIAKLATSGEFDRARTMCDFVLNMAKSANDTKGISRALNERGITLQKQDRFADAMKDFEEAKSISESIGDHEEYARSLLSIGNVYNRQQNYPPALQYFQQSLDLYRKLNHLKGQAQNLNLMANVYDYQGFPQKALESYEQSLKLYEKLQDSTGIARVQVNRATVFADMGLHDRALQSYSAAAKVFESTGERPSLAIVLSNAGNSFVEKGHYRLGLQYHLRALKIREELGLVGDIPASLVNIGFIHEKQGNYDLSLDYYLQAYAQLQKLSEADSYVKAIALGNVGGIYALTGKYEAALDYFQKSRTLREQIGDRGGVGSNHYATAGTYELMRQYSKAREHYDQAIKIFKTVNQAGNLVQALLGLSNVAFAEKKFEEAERFAVEAHELTEELEMPDLLCSALTQHAKILIHKGQKAEAEALLLKAMEGVESLREQVVGDETASQQFLTSREEPFYLMIGLMLDQNRNEEAFRYAERIKGRVLLDVLQSGRVEITKHMSADETQKEQELIDALTMLNASLRAEKGKEKPDASHVAELTQQIRAARMALEAFRTNLYALHPVLKTQRAEIVSILPEQLATLLTTEDAILEYSVSENETFLFVWTKFAQSQDPELQVFRIPLQQKVLAEMTKIYRHQLGQRDLRVTESAHKLYEILMKPVEKQIAGKKRIVIVPDRQLWELPFQVLESKKGVSVMEHFSVSYASSVSVLYEMKKAEGSVHSTTALLAMASTGGAEATEVNALSKLYGEDKSRIYTGRQAQEGVLKSEASKFEIIHVATHGVLNNASPMYSYLTLAKEQGEDGLLEPWEIMNLDLNTALVVLSSCESGGGKIGAGEGMIGFTWALFVAGSPSTVVSQWKVDSKSTASLMLEFHRNLRIGKLSKSEALRQAALKLRKDPRYRHPYYWAGFIVIGDPSPI